MTADGKHLVSAPLFTRRPAADAVSVYFSADPAHLPNCTLTIVVNNVPLGGTGYRFKVKDFIEVAKAR
jgi:hypothetical protein